MEPFPPLEPYDHGLLDVGDGNLVYWETCGNPDGQAGSRRARRAGLGLRHRKPPLLRPGALPDRPVRPARLRPQPPARERPAVDMSANTTHHLIADMERLREHLGIERWLLCGGSWGSTLILAYAERYPERVSEVVILGVTMTRRSEIDWLYRGVGPLLPRGVGPLPARRAGGGPGRRPRRRLRAAAREPGPRRPREGDVRLERLGGRGDLARVERPPGAYSDRPPDAALAFVRICTHYFSHGAWLEEGELLANAGRLAGIPGVLLHGRHDLGSPRRHRLGAGTGAGRDPSSSSSTTPATPAATRCAARAAGDGALQRSTLSRGSRPRKAPIRSASASTPARSARVSFRAGSTVSSIRFAVFLRLQIPAQTPSTSRNGVPAGPFVAALAVRRDLLAHRGRHELLALAEAHHVDVVLRQQADSTTPLPPAGVGARGKSRRPA